MRLIQVIIFSEMADIIHYPPKVRVLAFSGWERVRLGVKNG
jgi:hypothetical protein